MAQSSSVSLTDAGSKFSAYRDNKDNKTLQNNGVKLRTCPHANTLQLFK